jgi:hypothetical protein
MTQELLYGPTWTSSGGRHTIVSGLSWEPSGRPPAPCTCSQASALRWPTSERSAHTAAPLASWGGGESMHPQMLMARRGHIMCKPYPAAQHPRHWSHAQLAPTSTHSRPSRHHEKTGSWE